MDEEELQKQLLSEFQDYSCENEDEGKKENLEIGKAIGAFILISFIWIKGIRSNSNLIYVPNEQQIYAANGENKTYDAIRFRCYVENCQCKVYLRKDGTAVCEANLTHRHESMYAKYREMECINAMKNICLTAPASTTVREIYDQAVLE